MRAAFYVSPHEPDKVALADGFVAACAAAGVRLVFAGVHIDQPSRLLRALQRGLFGLLLPHYRGKLHVGEVMARSAVCPVVLVPANFMQNDEVFRGDILAGVFPMPLAGSNWVDLRDVGEVAAEALLRADVPAGVYSLVGPETLSGAQCAQTWARELGRPVRYLGGDDAAWATTLQQRLTGRKRDDWQASFRFLKAGAADQPQAPRDHDPPAGPATALLRDLCARHGHRLPGQPSRRDQR